MGEERIAEENGEREVLRGISKKTLHLMSGHWLVKAGLDKGPKAGLVIRK